MNVLKRRFSIVTLALILASFIGIGFAGSSGEESKKQARITKIKQSLLFVPHHLGDVALFHSEERGFWVVHNAQEHPIDDFLLDQQLQGISSDALDAFLCDGLISIIPHDSGEFELEACHSEAGKGPLLGRFAAYAVRGVAYGIIMFSAAGATGLLDRAIVGEETAEAGEILGFGLTQNAHEKAISAAGVVEVTSSFSSQTASLGTKVASGIAAISGAHEAIPAIEALALTVYGICCFVPGP